MDYSLDTTVTEHPVVSVCMITYQHAPYIRQALDSVLMQRVAFPIEICIGEDESTDGTRGICQEYAAKHPDKIRLFLRDRASPARQQYRAPFMHNFVETIKACRGEYVALLDGDDYWTDPRKLHVQIEFLQAHVGYSLCFSNGVVIYENAGTDPHPLHHQDRENTLPGCSLSRQAPRDTTTIEDLAKTNYIHTASAVFRNWIHSRGIPEWFAEMPVGDWPLHLVSASLGAIKYMPEQLIAHRIHSGGAWSQVTPVVRSAASLRVQALVLSSGLLPKSIQECTAAKLPLRLLHLRRICLESGRLDVHDDTLECFAAHMPEVISGYLGLLHSELDRASGDSALLRSTWHGRCVLRLARALSHVLPGKPPASQHPS